ncbi:hypothetical protein BC827DRAFT_1283391 [Russula dissimulans]|nr:hypothetical protein BC827DRAFT_1283391 [Russula dissimulans]
MSSEVNLSMKTPGPPSQSISLHPLDVTALGMDGDGKPVTIWTMVSEFVPASAVPELQSLDVQGAFGQSVLRNVYFGVNYGDACGGRDTGAFIQFLPTTDAAKAHSDFEKERLKQKTSGTKESLDNKKSGPLVKYKIPILATVAGVAVLATIISVVASRRKRAYRTLNEPAADGDSGMQLVKGYNAGLLQYSRSVDTAEMMDRPLPMENTFQVV